MSHHVKRPTETAGTRDTAALSLAEQLSLWAIRAWVSRRLQGLGPCPGFYRAFVLAGAPQAAPHLAGFMSVLAVGARRDILVNCPKCPEITPDEERLLAALGAAQFEAEVVASDWLDSLMIPPAVRDGLPRLWRFGRALLDAGMSLPYDPEAGFREAEEAASLEAQRCPDRGAALIH